MTAGWTGSFMGAGDVAWHAWYRLGVHPYRVALDGDTPDALRPLGEATETVVATLTRQVLDECDVRLYGEARERVVADAQRDVVHHVLWAVVDAVRRELMRPEPVPFAPPLAGSWIRGRWLARPAVRRLAARPPTWDGLWHLFAGDLETHPFHVNDVKARARCGARITLRSEHAEAALAETMPGVEACRRCARAREAVTT